MHGGSHGFGVEEGTPRGEEKWWKCRVCFILFCPSHPFSLHYVPSLVPSLSQLRSTIVTQQALLPPPHYGALFRFECQKGSYSYPSPRRLASKRAHTRYLFIATFCAGTFHKNNTYQLWGLPVMVDTQLCTLHDASIASFIQHANFCEGYEPLNPRLGPGYRAREIYWCLLPVSNISVMSHPFPRFMLVRPSV